MLRRLLKSEPVLRICLHEAQNEVPGSWGHMVWNGVQLPMQCVLDGPLIILRPSPCPAARPVLNRISSTKDLARCAQFQSGTDVYIYNRKTSYLEGISAHQSDVEGDTKPPGIDGSRILRSSRSILCNAFRSYGVYSSTPVSLMSSMRVIA